MATSTEGTSPRSDISFTPPRGIRPDHRPAGGGQPRRRTRHERVGHAVGIHRRIDDARHFANDGNAVEVPSQRRLELPEAGGKIGKRRQYQLVLKLDRDERRGEMARETERTRLIRDLASPIDRVRHQRPAARDGIQPVAGSVFRPGRSSHSTASTAGVGARIRAPARWGKQSSLNRFVRRSSAMWGSTLGLAW